MKEIKPSQQNTNKHTDEGMKLLDKSIRQSGVIESIAVATDGTIITGHARFETFNNQGKVPKFIKLESNEYPVIETDIENNTKEYFEAQILANTTANKNFDLDIEMIEVIAEEFDIDIDEVGVEVEEVDEVLEATEDDFDTTPPSIAKTVLGDLYEIGEHRLLCGDSTCSDTVAKLMNGEKADMVFTDPPYGVDYSSQHVGLYSNGSNKTKSRDVILNDKDTRSIIEFMPLLKEYCNGIAYVFCGAGKELDLLKSIKDNKYELINTLIWNKQKGTGALNANYKPCFELFYYIKIQGDRLWSGNSSEWTVWDIEYKKDNTLHPTQKPILLVEKAIKNHNTKSVLDLFLGSGSTMVASHQLKRKCYGMELDPKYCDVIVKRMLKLDSSLTIKRNGIDCKFEFISE